jgi:hypothetical protein
VSNSKARNLRCTIDLPSNTALCRIPPPGVTILLSDSQHGPLSFAKTPHEAILVHVASYAVSLYVIDFTCALDLARHRCCIDLSNAPR